MSPFSKTLSVGAAAALSLPLSLAVFTPWLGRDGALALHAVLSVSLYLAVLASGTRRIAVFAAAALAGTATCALAASWVGLVVLLGVVVAGFRGACLVRRGRARAVVVESGVLVLATATAAGVLLWAPTGVLAVAVAIWGWFVAQSLGVLVVDGEAARTRRDDWGDPFDEVARRLEALLDAPPDRAG